MSDPLRAQPGGLPVGGAAALARAPQPGGRNRLSQWLDREDVLGYLLVTPVVIVVIGLLVVSLRPVLEVLKPVRVTV